MRSLSPRSSFALAAAFLVLNVAGPTAADAEVVKCVSASGNAGVKCLTKGAKLLAEKVDPADGFLVGVTQKTSKTVVKTCDAADAETLGYLDVPDITTRTNDACELFAYEMNGLVYDAAQVGLTPEQTACRTLMYKWLSKVRKVVTVAWGKKCIVTEYKGGVCDRAKRDQKIAKIRGKAASSLEAGCGADFDVIATFDGATLTDRIETFVDTVVTRGKHYAQRVFPPNNMGPTAEFGSYPVGITTLDLVDISRLNVPGDGPRPVTVEVYYPSTSAAVAGEPQEVVQLFGLDLATVPAYRDVDLAAGSFPLVVFSHGNNGIRIQSFFFAGHLASHGYIVVAADHHGNTFPDTLASIVDPDPAVNRPLDMSFVIDEFTTLNADVGGFFEGAIDLAKIGASGHSFGGYTSLALAGGSFGLGTFTDPRVSAVFPQAPTVLPFTAAYFPTITIPTLIVGGTIDETTPFETDQQFPFDNMVPGASVVGLAEVDQAGHFTFSSFCEVDPAVLAFLGGFEEACEPRHLPWRHAQDITKYLALNFFDATLNADAAALARLDPPVLAGFEDLVYQSK
jgi:predicted dienelactone hydrolase